MKSSDEVLMVALIERDECALESLYDRYRSLLYSVAFRIVGDAASAEEIVQDIFFQLWQRAGQFDASRGSLAGWLLTLTRNRAISRLRKENHSPHFQTNQTIAGQISTAFDDGATALPCEVGFTGAMDELETNIARQLIVTTLGLLSGPQREAITLAYFEGLTHEEISVRTGTPLGTTKTRLRTALRTLRRSLSNRNRESPGRHKTAPGTLDDILTTGELLCRPSRQRGRR